MKYTRLFKGQTAVVVVLTLMFCSPLTVFAKSDAAATAQSQPPPGSPGSPGYGYPPTREERLLNYCPPDKLNTTDCQRIADILGIQGTSDRKCEDLDNEFRKQQGLYKTNCRGASCVNKIIACGDTEASIAETFIDDTGADTFNLGSCDNLVNTKCPEKNAGTAEDYKSEKDTLQERADQRQKDVRDLMAENQKKSFEDQKNLVELQRNAENVQRDMRDQQTKTMDNIKKQIEGATRAKMEIYRAARKAYDDIDKEYITARDQARAVANAVLNAQNNLETTCRQYAEAKYNADEQTRNSQMIQQMERGKKNLGSAAGAAGQVKREIKYRNKQRKLNYVGYFNDCKNGVSGVGATSIAKIKEMQSDKQRKDANLVDIAANLEKQRIQVVNDAQVQDTTIDQQTQTLIQSLQQQLNNMSQDYAQLQQRQQQDYQLAVQQATQQQQTTQGQVGLANSQLMQTNSELMMANMRHSCALSSGGNIKASAGDRRIEQLETASGALGELAQICARAQSLNCPSFVEEKKDQKNKKDGKTSNSNMNACNTYVDNMNRVESGEDDSFNR